jgi:hypothetical protein
MASRERKRESRQKRKRRSRERSETVAARREQMAARSEARNRAAREALEPLAEGERPTVVTVGAVIAALVAVAVIVAYAAGAEVDRFSSDGIELGSERPPLVSVIIPVALMGLMAWGMWRARYWAVLGFQTLLLILIVATALGLVGATEWTQAIGNTLVLAIAGTLFYLMIKALARIQMPERVPRE